MLLHSQMNDLFKNKLVNFGRMKTKLGQSLCLRVVVRVRNLIKKTGRWILPLKNRHTSGHRAVPELPVPCLIGAPDLFASSLYSEIKSQHLVGLTIREKCIKTEKKCIHFKIKPFKIHLMHKIQFNLKFEILFFCCDNIRIV